MGASKIGVRVKMGQQYMRAKEERQRDLPQWGDAAYLCTSRTKTTETSTIAIARAAATSVTASRWPSAVAGRDSCPADFGLSDRRWSVASLPGRQRQQVARDC